MFNLILRQLVHKCDSPPTYVVYDLYSIFCNGSNLYHQYYEVQKRTLKQHALIYFQNLNEYDTT